MQEVVNLDGGQYWFRSAGLDEYVPSDSVHPFRKNAMVMIRILGQLSYLKQINNSIQSIKEAFKVQKIFIRR